MRARVAPVAAVVLLAAGGGYLGGTAWAGGRAQGCEDWVGQTNERVNAARGLLYPADRPGAFAGTPEQAAEQLSVLFEEQADSAPPEGARQVNGDLVEALSVGAEGLAAGGPEAAAIVFAKAIVYTADARLLAVVNTC
jgi:hypothetical protein